MVKGYDQKREVLVMTMIIRLSDEQAMALEAKAAAEGLSVEEWIQKLAQSGNVPPEARTGADLIAALQSSPHRDIDIEPERYRLPVRGVTL
jgi:plasmid stability protein